MQQPRWQETILQRQLKPAALRAGIGKIVWHTFRHTYSTMLRSAGTDIKVQKELLRHANIQTTMNIYTQAVDLAPVIIAGAVAGHQIADFWSLILQFRPRLRRSG